MVDMLEARMEDEQIQFDNQHQLLAWQTALLMNATGNFKKRIKPEMLIGKRPEEATEDTEDNSSNSEVNRLDRDEKNKQLDELKNKFSHLT